MTIRK